MLTSSRSTHAFVVVVVDVVLFSCMSHEITYSHLSNNRGGWNKRGGGAKVAKSINVEVGINMEGGISWKNLLYKCNKRGVEGGKSKKSINVQGGIFQSR